MLTGPPSRPSLFPEARLVAVLVVLSFFGACVEQGPMTPQTGAAYAPQLAKGGKPGTNPGPVEETPSTMAFADRQSDAIRSDGLGPYVHDECGVSAVINSTSDDALLDPDASKIRRKDAATCGTDVRGLQLDLGWMVAEGGFMNVDKVRTVTGADVRRAQFNIEPCNRLVFDPTEFAGTDHVEVERIDDTTWRVHAEDGFAKARCVDVGADVSMPFSVTIRILP